MGHWKRNWCCSYEIASERTVVDLISTEVWHPYEWSLEGLQDLTWLPHGLNQRREALLRQRMDSLFRLNNHFQWPLPFNNPVIDLSPFYRGDKKLSQNIIASPSPLNLYNRFWNFSIKNVMPLPALLFSCPWQLCLDKSLALRWRSFYYFNISQSHSVPISKL